MTAVSMPTLAAGVEEGEIVVGETLLSLSLRGGDFPGGSSALSSDKEVEMLEGLNLDEAGKIRFPIFVNPLFVTLEYPSFYFLRSCLCVDEATFGSDARAWNNWDSSS